MGNVQENLFITICHKFTNDKILVKSLALKKLFLRKPG
jgi:hypothetical protein